MTIHKQIKEMDALLHLIVSEEIVELFQISELFQLPVRIPPIVIYLHV